MLQSERYASVQLSSVPRTTGASLTAHEFSELYRRCGALVLRRCRAILGDAAEAEDVMHDVFVRLMRYGKFTRAADVPLGFLYRTAERCCFDRRKRAHREGPSESEDNAQVLSVDAGQGRAYEARAFLERFARTVPMKLRSLAALHFLDGLPQERIGRELGWSLRTVCRKIAQLEGLVRAMAQPEGCAC